VYKPTACGGFVHKSAGGVWTVACPPRGRRETRLFTVSQTARAPHEGMCLTTFGIVSIFVHNLTWGIYEQVLARPNNYRVSAGFAGCDADSMRVSD
jgi:hypothetical protein